MTFPSDDVSLVDAAASTAACFAPFAAAVAALPVDLTDDAGSVNVITPRLLSPLWRTKLVSSFSQQQNVSGLSHEFAQPH